MTEDEYAAVVALTRAKEARNIVEGISPVRGVVKAADRDGMLAMLESWCSGLFKRVLAVRDELIDGAGEGGIKIP